MTEGHPVLWDALWRNVHRAARLRAIDCLGDLAYRMGDNPYRHVVNAGVQRYRTPV